MKGSYGGELSCIFWQQMWRYYLSVSTASSLSLSVCGYWGVERCRLMLSLQFSCLSNFKANWGPRSKDMS